MQEKIVELIRRVIPDDGWHIWGLADLSGLLHERFKGYKYGICIGKRLDDPVIDSIITGTNMEYYRLYKDTNIYLLGLVTDLAAKLNALGVGSLPITPTSNQLYRSPEYARTLRHYFSQKWWAHGQAWVGSVKATCSSQ